MPKTKKIITSKKRLSVEILRQMLSLATSGFGLVAALAWNNVIQDFVNNYVKIFFPKGSSLVSLLLYAIVVTLFAVFVTFQLSRLLEKVDPEADSLKLK